MIKRELLSKLKDQCFRGKIILLLGARQVGKTTLLKQLSKQIATSTLWLNADEADILQELNMADTSTRLLGLIGKQTKLLIIDEAQQIKNIGKKLKLLHDANPDIQVIATGSSSFDLLNRMAEPLTGRKRIYHLFPISFQELVDKTNLLEAKRMLEKRLIFGSYPEVINNPGNEKEVLLEISQSYLYKDVLKLEGIRKSSHLEKLLQALAFQVGSEVKYSEIANSIGNINALTVEKYLDILEKAYIIFKLPALSRNMRNEIKKGKKYYFYDNGIRNAIISNYAPLEMRLDKGALWENFLVSERLKQNHYNSHTPNTYFWRTLDQAEIDYVEEFDGKLWAYQMKWKETKTRFPESFMKAYPNHETHVINHDNFDAFIRNS